MRAHANALLSLSKYDMMSGYVLLFGFGPFGDYAENPSELVARKLHGTLIGDHPVKGVVLPVAYREMEEGVARELALATPAFALGLGLAPGRASVNVEKFALNFRQPDLKDITGSLPPDQVVDPGGAVAYMSDLPTEDLVKHLKAQGIPARVSLSAGSYLCNALMYVLLREGARMGFPAGFVHVPCHEELAAKLKGDVPSMNLETLARAVRITVEYALSHATKPAQRDAISRL